MLNGIANIIHETIEGIRFFIKLPRKAKIFISSFLFSIIVIVAIFVSGYVLISYINTGAVKEAINNKKMLDGINILKSDFENIYYKYKPTVIAYVVLKPLTLNYKAHIVYYLGDERAINESAIKGYIRTNDFRDEIKKLDNHSDFKMNFYKTSLLNNKSRAYISVPVFSLWRRFFGFIFISFDRDIHLMQCQNLSIGAHCLDAEIRRDLLFTALQVGPTTSPPEMAIEYADNQIKKYVSDDNIHIIYSKT